MQGSQFKNGGGAGKTADQQIGGNRYKGQRESRTRVGYGRSPEERKVPIKQLRPPERSPFESREEEKGRDPAVARAIRIPTCASIKPQMFI
jgi:hypothetical protein